MAVVVVASIAIIGLATLKESLGKLISPLTATPNPAHVQSPPGPSDPRVAAGARPDESLRSLYEAETNSPHHLRGGKPVVGRLQHTVETSVVGPGRVKLTGPGVATTGTQQLNTRRVSEIQVVAADRVKVMTFMDKTDTETEIGGKKTLRSTRGELDGTSLIGTLSSGTWSFDLDIGEASEKQRKKIAEFGRLFSLADEDFYPDRGLAIGETWSATPMAVRRFMEIDDVLSAQGTITLTLRNIVVCGNEKCAQIDKVVEASAKFLTDNEEMDYQIGGTERTLRSLVSFVDLESSFAGEMVMKGDHQVGDRMVRIEHRGPINIKRTTTVK